VSGIAVTDAFNRLYGNISATDLNIIGPDYSAFDQLTLSVEEYMKAIPPNRIFGFNPIFIKLVDPLKLLVKMFVDSGIHRIYVVHNVMRICGIISMIDLIKYIIQVAAPKPEHFNM